MPHHMLPSLTSFTGLAGAALLLAGFGAALLVPLLKRMSRPLVGRVALAFLAFQAFHLLEHVIQLGYWFRFPDARPYMTPWALEGVDGIAAWFALLPVDAVAMAGGMEGLHLVGNVIFLVGIIALGYSSSAWLPGLQTAFVLQGLHVAEHVLLTTTLILFDTPLGVSTLFGAADGYSWAPTLRVWFHFLINLGATIPAAWALWTWRTLESASAEPSPAIDLHEPALAGS